eukprot:CAMPEP_0172167740 /NCGR_PEP_ID=MMETSP1050-20130122/9744_1 /TAXON_ID=233186 /ORGANISM="Cryptomonas curvata, Strain CCAP979/52" /LENGTH=509 /DNA_ID=CAMNT_0012838573 /DNA_START=722 /DNA_END=2251 /DNA_ORIENTATION=-
MLDDIDSCEWFNASKPTLWSHLLSALLLFHAVIKGRNKFNPVGWKETYDFDSGDFICAKSILLLFVDQFDEMQWTALKYITSQIVYGGRITDDMDQRCLSCIMDFLYCDAGHKSSHPLKYQNEILENVSAFADLQKNIYALPDVDDIEMYGMHTNAILSLEFKDSMEFLNSVSSLRLLQENKDIVSSVPNAYHEGLKMVEAVLCTFSSKEISKDIKNPPRLSNPLDIVLQHEMAMCNGLFSVVRCSLERASSALKGQEIMSLELDEIVNSLLLNKVPRCWAVELPSTNKTLTAWIKNLCNRTDFFQRWSNASATPILWLAAFSFPKGLVTACLQSELRMTALDMSSSVKDDASCSHSKTLSSFTMSLVITDVFFGDDTLPVSTDHRFYAYGLCLEQGSWDLKKRLLVAPIRGQIWAAMPIVIMQPLLVSKQSGHCHAIVTKRDSIPQQPESYLCPLYQSAARRSGTSSSGQSSNLVLCTLLPTSEPPSTWILRGTAMSLDSYDSDDNLK